MTKAKAKALKPSVIHKALTTPGIGGRMTIDTTSSVKSVIDCDELPNGRFVFIFSLDGAWTLLSNQYETREARDEAVKRFQTGKAEYFRNNKCFVVRIYDVFKSNHLYLGSWGLKPEDMDAVIAQTEKERSTATVQDLPERCIGKYAI